MGWRIKRVSTGALLVSVCAAVLLASAGVTAAGERLAYAVAVQERPVFVAVGATTRAPIGWIEFCVEYKPECKTKPEAARDIVLTPKDSSSSSLISEMMSASCESLNRAFNSRRIASVRVFS